MMNIERESYELYELVKLGANEKNWVRIDTGSDRWIRERAKKIAWHNKDAKLCIIRIERKVVMQTDGDTMRFLDTNGDAL